MEDIRKVEGRMGSNGTVTVSLSHPCWAVLLLFDFHLNSEQNNAPHIQRPENTLDRKHEVLHKSIF